MGGGDQSISIPLGGLRVTANSGRFTVRSYFSTRLLWSAQHYAHLAQAIEDRQREGDSIFDIEHNAHVLAAVFGAVGFLEANVNELFQDAADGHGEQKDGYIAPLTPETRKLMRHWWAATGGGARPRILDKYQALLDFADQPTMLIGQDPYQSAAALVRLRNVVVHYRPESLPTDDRHDLEALLHGRFPPNQLMAGAPTAFWPNLCLGAGCAAWAHRTAVALADHVRDQIGITPNYRRVIATHGFNRAPGTATP